MTQPVTPRMLAAGEKARAAGCDLALIYTVMRNAEWPRPNQRIRAKRAFTIQMFGRPARIAEGDEFIVVRNEDHGITVRRPRNRTPLKTPLSIELIHREFTS